jgi:EAL domain-containing protein (putative c-di-GMP-specific phosphodiesterase class I)
LNIEVVAEGIETQSVLEKVNVTKCDYVQGNFYSAPVQPNEIEHMFVAQPFRQ